METNLLHPQSVNQMHDRSVAIGASYIRLIDNTDTAAPADHVIKLLVFFERLAVNAETIPSRHLLVVKQCKRALVFLSACSMVENIISVFPAPVTAHSKCR